MFGKPECGRVIQYNQRLTATPPASGCTRTRTPKGLAGLLHDLCTGDGAQVLSCILPATRRHSGSAVAGSDVLSCILRECRGITEKPGAAHNPRSLLYFHVVFCLPTNPFIAVHKPLRRASAFCGSGFDCGSAFERGSAFGCGFAIDRGFALLGEAFGLPVFAAGRFFLRRDSGMGWGLPVWSGLLPPFGPLGLKALQAVMRRRPRGGRFERAMM